MAFRYERPKKLVILETRKLAAFMIAISNYLQKGRSIREIRLVLKDSDQNVNRSMATDGMNLNTDDKAKSF